jgi:hypothetical protein
MATDELTEEIEAGAFSPSEQNPDTQLPDEKTERDIVKEIVDSAKKSNDFFGVENERKRDDARVYADVVAFSKTDRKAITNNRGIASVNPLPLYVNATKNLFLTNPFIAQVEGQNGDKFRDFADKQLHDIFANSDADNSVFSEGLQDIMEEGVGYMYLTIEDGQIEINLAYEPSACIYDPCSRKLDGSDAQFFGIVEQLPYERVKQMAEENGVTIPSKDRMPITETWSFANFNSSFGSVNLVHFYKRCDDGVYFIQVVGDKVIKRVLYRGLSCLPVVPIYGQRFKDDGKKLYKGVVRDTKHLCKIVNGCYVSLWERVSVPSVPYTSVSMEAVENLTPDYENDMARFKRYRAYTQIGDSYVPVPEPKRVDPTVVTGDLLPVINDSLMKISKMIGIPEEGLGFSGSAAVEKTAQEILTRSSALVTNVSHYYRHLQRSIQHISEIIVELLCLYNDVPNTYSIKLMKGPEDALKREQRRQQILAFQTLAPESVKPLLLAEAIKTGDFENAEAIANAVMLTLPPELKGALNMATGVDVAALQQQVAALTQQAQQQAQQIEDYRRTIDADIIAGQNQLLITRMNNEAALRSKLVELEAKAAENEKDRQIELAKLTAEQRVEAEKLFIESRNADTRAREATVKALQEAERLRMESEKNTAELAMKLSGNVKNTLTDNVIVQSPTV